MSSFASEASLIVAAFDLLAVRAVTGASRAADLESGDVLTPSGIVEKPEPAPTPDVDRYEPDPQPPAQLAFSHPPIYSRCPTAHHLRNSPSPKPMPVIVPACDLPAEPASAPTNPIQPPWKVLPWMERSPQRIVVVKEIKVITRSSDMSGRGKMIDLVA